MSEHDAVLKAGENPATLPSLLQDLEALGVLPGSVLLVHSSLSSMGWVCGGPVAATAALIAAVGEDGTLAMPTHSADLSEPSLWQHPPVPETWWPLIRELMPPFDPAVTPSRGMGRIPEVFRSVPGTLRSYHPKTSFAARGLEARRICGQHDLEDGLGDETPLGELYRLGAQILLLGVGHERNTSLHLAERYAFGTTQVRVGEGMPVVRDGRRIWFSFDEPEAFSDDFAALGTDFERETGAVSVGSVGRAEARLMPMRALVDYGVGWLRRNRSEDGRPPHGADSAG